MKKLIFSILGLMIGISVSAATTCTWNGTSGNWDNPDNWIGGVRPTDGAGDTVVITSASEGAVIENDMGEISIATLIFDTPNPVTLQGAAIRVTAGIATRTASVVKNDLVIDGNVNLNAGSSTYGGQCRPTFDGAITIGAGRKFVVFGNSGSVFNGSVTGVEGTIAFGSGVYLTGEYIFNGPVTVDKIIPNGYPACAIRFKNPDNHWNQIDHLAEEYIYFDAPGAMPEESVLNFTSTGSDRCQYRGFYLTSDVVANRIECSGTCPVEARGSISKRDLNWIKNPTTSGGTITLTLKGTADAKTSCSFRMNYYGINLVWDPVGDYTQEFTETYSDCENEITVKRGTIKLTGDSVFRAKSIYVKANACFDLDVANENSLLKLTRIDLEQNARFKVGASTIVPFTQKPTVTMGRGAKFVVATGASIELGSCSSPNGLELPVGTYTGTGASGTKVNWIEGEGTVIVTTASADRVFWKNAEDGLWREGDNWVGGAVPAAGKPVAIACNDASYTVTVDATPASPTGLIVANETAKKSATLDVAAQMTINVNASRPLIVGEGGVVKIGKEGTLALVTASNCSDALNVRDGGLFEIGGGKLTVSTLYGRFNVLGLEGQQGVFRISSGTCEMSHTQNSRLFIGENGRLEMTGGSFYASAYNTYYRTVELGGGTIDLSNDAAFWTAVSRTPYQGYGTINLSGNAVFRTHPTSSAAAQSRVYFEPLKTSDVLSIDVVDHAKYDLGSAVETDFGGAYGGLVTARFASDQRHYLGSWGYIGAGSGNADVKLEAGELAVGDNGLVIGGMGDTDRFSSPVYSQGRLVMTGGKVSVSGGNAAQPKNGPQYGFLIGCCPVWGASETWAGSSVKGTFELSSGEVTNVYGFTHVGLGAAKGLIVQTGGFLGTANGRDVLIGAYSGEGEWIVSNGVSQVRSTVYVGGVTSNDIGRTGYARYYPEELIGSKGRIEVSGGVFEGQMLKAGLTRGLGSAVVEVGMAGELKVTGAELDNVKVIRRLGGAGTGAFSVAGSLMITGNASLEIDASALSDQNGGKFTLLSYTGERTGDFAKEKVRLTGFKNPSAWTVGWVGKSLKCRYKSGMILMVR